MKTSELTTSKYLKQSDFPQPKIVTIGNITKENIAMDNQPKKMRGVIFFEEFEKGMVLNPTNLKRAEKALGTDEMDDWIGQKLIVYVDADVEYGGEIVGGLRLRAVKTKKPLPAKDPFDEIDEDVPQ